MDHCILTPDQGGAQGIGIAGPTRKVSGIAAEFDVDAMLQRFRARARAVRQRGIPPVEGPDRKRFVDQARIDFQDYAIVGDAMGRVDDGILTLTVDLRPKPDASQVATGADETEPAP